MAKPLLEKFEEDFFTLVEAGFIAVNAADEDSALKLFKAAEILRPDNSLPQLGYGYMYMCKLELKQAATLFKKVLEKDPNNEIANTLLGLTLSMNPSGGSEGDKILENACKSKDPEVKHLAKDSAKFIEEFIKKKPTPMELERKTATKGKNKPKNK